MTYNVFGGTLNLDQFNVVRRLTIIHALLLTYFSAELTY